MNPTMLLSVTPLSQEQEEEKMEDGGTEQRYSSESNE